MATTIGTIAIVVDAIVPVYARAIGVEVATSAIRLVDRSLPVHCLRIILMAAGAGEIAGVIQRLVTQTHVLVDMRSPSIGRMAVIALKIRHKVPLVLAGRRVAIMAGEAGANDLRVIHHVGRRKRYVVVAILTNIGGIDVRWILARRIGAVMAADAVVSDIGVIKVGRDPPAGCMAVVAVIATGNVGRVLAFGNIAIMAGEAGANDLRMIDHIGGYKRHDVVAVFADHSGVDVCRILPDSLDAIMTAGAIPADAGVVKIGGCPAGRRVAVIAIVAARNMASILTQGNGSVVTAETGANDLCMVNDEYRIPR